jgi:hypothetical protein
MNGLLSVDVVGSQVGISDQASVVNCCLEIRGPGLQTACKPTRGGVLRASVLRRMTTDDDEQAVYPCFYKCFKPRRHRNFTWLGAATLYKLDSTKINFNGHQTKFLKSN